MKEIFNINRFGALWLKTNRENLKANLILLAAMAVVIFLCLCKFSPFAPEYSVVDSEASVSAFMAKQAVRQYAVFWGVMFFFSVVVAARSFKDVMSPYKAINTLLLPASSFEKYLLAFLNSTVFFFVVYVLLFYGLDWLVNTYKYCGINQAHYTTGLLGMRVPEIGEGQQLLRPSLVNVLDFSTRDNGFSLVTDSGYPFSSYNAAGRLYVLCFWLYLTAIFMWGSITFRRRTVLLTSLLHLLLFLGIGYAIYLIVHGTIDIYTKELAYRPAITMKQEMPSPYWGLLFYLLPVMYFWVAWIKLIRKQLK